MQTDILENLDALSPECRHELKGQIKRVQVEARRLKEQMRHLRKAEHAERARMQQVEKVEHVERAHAHQLQKEARAEQKARKHALKQMEKVSDKGWRKRERTNDAEFIPMDVAHREERRPDWNERAGRAAHNVADWRDDTAHHLRKQGQQLAQQTTDWRDGTTHRLYKQSREVTQHMAEWKDDLIYMLLRQGQHFLQSLIDRRDETTRSLRKQGRQLGRNLSDRTDDVAWQLHKQRRHLGRNLSEQRDDAARHLRKRGKELNRNLSDHNTLWSTLGFATGLLVAGGAVYWLMKRVLHHTEEVEEQQIELQRHDTLNGMGVSTRGGEIRYSSQGGTAVATRRTTRADPTSRFVGVLSTLRYYPLELQPEASERDLVFFRSEEDARAEGFVSAR